MGDDTLPRRTAAITLVSSSLKALRRYPSGPTAGPEKPAWWLVGGCWWLVAGEVLVGKEPVRLGRRRILTAKAAKVAKKSDFRAFGPLPQSREAQLLRG